VPIDTATAGGRVQQIQSTVPTTSGSHGKFNRYPAAFSAGKGTVAPKYFDKEDGGGGRRK